MPSQATLKVIQACNRAHKHCQVYNFHSHVTLRTVLIHQYRFYILGATLVFLNGERSRMMFAKTVPACESKYSVRSYYYSWVIKRLHVACSRDHVRSNGIHLLLVHCMGTASAH